MKEWQYYRVRTKELINQTDGKDCIMTILSRELKCLETSIEWVKESN